MRYFFTVVFTLLISACSSNHAVSPTAKIEFRPASFEPQTGATEMIIEASQQKVYVLESILLSTPDIAEAAATFDAQGMPSVGLKLTPTGKQKLTDATVRYMDKPIAVIVNGKLLTAPVVREKITGGMMIITGFLSAQQTKDVADGLSK
jgi:preprotein translocase subunit SecD